jgi:hypothetical protein
VRKFDSDIFIIIHHKEGDKIYTYQNKKEFSLERITDLIQRDLKRCSFLKKNEKFKDSEFD